MEGLGTQDAGGPPERRPWLTGVSPGRGDRLLSPSPRVAKAATVAEEKPRYSGGSS